MAAPWRRLQRALNVSIGLEEDGVKCSVEAGVVGMECGLTLPVSGWLGVRLF